MTANRTKECIVDGCDRNRRTGDYCHAHYQQVLAGKTPGQIRRARGAALERDEQGRKWCSAGKHWEDVARFAVDSSGALDGLQHRCTPCMKLAKFGVSRDQYAALLVDQNGGCAICGGTNKNGNALAVDHDHDCCPGKRSCGKCVRGLLCSNCNLVLGLVSDSRDRLASAGWYLRKHGK